MIIDTTIILYKWANKVINGLPFKYVRIILQNGEGLEGYIVGETTTGFFFKEQRAFKENIMFAEWFPFSCLVK